MVEAGNLGGWGALTYVIKKQLLETTHACLN